MKSLKVGFVCLMVLSVYTLSYGAGEKIFTIGALFPMTGPQAFYGRVMSHGALTAIDHLNADKKVEGYNFKLVITDFKNVDVPSAISGLQKMILVDKIPIVLTSFSAINLGVHPVCEASHIMMINGGAYSPLLSNKPYLYSTKLSQIQMAPPMLNYLWEMNVRKLGLIYIADAAGEGTAKELVEPLWTKMGGTIVASEPHKPGLTDYSPYLEKIKAGHADAIYNITTGQDIAYVIKGAREMGMTVPIVIPDWNNDWQMIAGKASENVFIPGDYFNLQNPDPRAQRFIKDYESKWKELPEIFAANYYEAVYYIIPELINRAIKAGADPLNGAELEKALRTDPSFNTIYGTGNIKFTPEGRVANKPMAIFKLVDGKRTVIKEVISE